MDVDTANPGSDDDATKKPEVALALLFGIAAIATAFSSFQASQLGGGVIANYNEGIRKVNQVSQLNNEGNQVVASDNAVFLEWFKEVQVEDGVSTYIYQNGMSPQLRAAVDWWADTKNSGPTPFTEKNPDYVVPQFEEAEALNEEVDAHFAAAAEADDEGTRFDLITVLLAVTLFFLGLSTVMKKRATRGGLMGIGAVTLAVSLVALLILMV